MSSTVCQGLQSCLEPRLIEPCIKPQFPEKPDDDMGKLSFFQALLNPTQSPMRNENVYVHPLAKRSSSRLSAKSLEICTESLGSETGENGYNLTWENIESNDKESRQKTREKAVKKKMKHSDSFPPPLTSISGSDQVQVCHHREGGRLVIKAVIVSCHRTCFETERSGSRLRLRLLKSCYDNDYNNLENDEREDDIENIEQDNEIVEVEHDNDEFYDEEDVEESNVNVGGENAIGKFPRPSRCKDGGRGREGVLWETFLVATS